MAFGFDLTKAMGRKDYMKGCFMKCLYAVDFVWDGVVGITEDTELMERRHRGNAEKCIGHELYELGMEGKEEVVNRWMDGWLRAQGLKVGTRRGRRFV